MKVEYSAIINSHKMSEITIKEYCKRDNIEKLEQTLHLLPERRANQIVHGSQPGDFGGETTTLLGDACEQWSSDCVRVLLQYGADVNLRNSHDDTPLHCVCRSKRDVTEKVGFP